VHAPLEPYFGPKSAVRIWSNCWRLVHASLPTVPETSILSFTVAMIEPHFYHGDTETRRKPKIKRLLRTSGTA